jgi:hypothetical protein
MYKYTSHHLTPVTNGGRVQKSQKSILHRRARKKSHLWKEEEEEKGHLKCEKEPFGNSFSKFKEPVHFKLPKTAHCTLCDGWYGYIWGAGRSRRESCLKLVNFLVVLFLSFALDIRGPPTVTKNFWLEIKENDKKKENYSPWLVASFNQFDCVIMFCQVLLKKVGILSNLYSVVYM